MPKSSCAYKKMSVMFFSIKFPIQWAFEKVSTIILKFFKFEFSMGGLNQKCLCADPKEYNYA